MGVTRDGGKPKERDVNKYQMPKGPTSLGNHGPGLGGEVTTHGQPKSYGKQGGKPGLGGIKHPSGSQRC